MTTAAAEIFASLKHQLRLGRLDPTTAPSSSTPSQVEKQEKKVPPANKEWRQKVIGLDESVHPAVEKMAKCAEWFIHACLLDIKRLKDGRHCNWMIFYGGTGAGKTHAARKVHAYVRDHQIDHWFKGNFWAEHLHFPALVHWDVVAGHEERDWSDVLYEIARVHLTVLDDIGGDVDQYRSGVPDNRLKHLLDLLENRWLLMTTNFGPSQWEERWGARIADRLSRAVRVDLSEVKSYRGL